MELDISQPSPLSNLVLAMIFHNSRACYADHGGQAWPTCQRIRICFGEAHDALRLQRCSIQLQNLRMTQTDNLLVRQVLTWLLTTGNLQALNWIVSKATCLNIFAQGKVREVFWSCILWEGWETLCLMPTCWLSYHSWSWHPGVQSQWIWPQWGQVWIVKIG